MTPGTGQFWPQGLHMNKIDTGPQGDATYNISKFSAIQYQRRIMNFSFFVPMFKLRPQGGANFDPMGILWTNLVDVHKEMPYTKYQIFTPSSFREEEFWRSASLFLCSNLWPPGWASFEPKGIIWTNLVEVHKKCYIPNIKALGLPVSEKNFEVCLLCSYALTFNHLKFIHLQ